MPDLLHIACPTCHAVNRAPRAKLAVAPSAKCGNCRVPLFTGQPVELDARSLEVHASAADIPLLVDFWAPWCAPCRAMAPELEIATRHLEPTLRVAKINTEAQPELAARFDIRGIPTLVLLRRGQEISRRTGLINAAAIERWVAGSLRSKSAYQPNERTGT